MGFTTMLNGVKVYVDYEVDIDNEIVIKGVEPWTDDILDIIDPRYIEDLEITCKIDQELKEDQS